MMNSNLQNSFAKKLENEKKLEELEKIIIIFDDAIDKGEHVKKVIEDIYKILGEKKNSKKLTLR